jgi:hypothetical protein
LVSGYFTFTLDFSLALHDIQCCFTVFFKPKDSKKAQTGSALLIICPITDFHLFFEYFACEYLTSEYFALFEYFVFDCPGSFSARLKFVVIGFPTVLCFMFYRKWILRFYVLRIANPIQISDPICFEYFAFWLLYFCFLFFVVFFIYG